MIIIIFKIDSDPSVCLSCIRDNTAENMLKKFGSDINCKEDFFYDGELAVPRASVFVSKF